MEMYRLEGLKWFFISHKMSKAPCLADFTRILGLLSRMNKLRFLTGFYLE
jgi:uncharacterized membrane protein